METFRARLSGASRRKGSRVILACDYPPSARSAPAVSAGIGELSPFLCAIKLNLHLLLPLGQKDVLEITDAAHGHGLQAIADIKLNDIGSTNEEAAGALWEMGFDAVIANPIMGPRSLASLAESVHGAGAGLITLCHMSAPGAERTYGAEVSGAGRTGKLYELFLDWAIGSGADGVVVGATFPGIISECARRIRRRKGGGEAEPWIISPGVGVQGGDAGLAVSAGSDYLIVGRSILSAEDPAAAARRICAAATGGAAAAAAATGGAAAAAGGAAAAAAAAADTTS